MKVTPSKLEFPLAMDDPNRDRTVLHASDIYNSYYEQSNPKRYGQKKDAPSPDLLFAMGLAWEQYFEKALKANGVECDRPGELTGEWKGKEIKYSPDLLILDNGEWWLGEIKLAWKSSRLKLTDKDFAKYLTQGRMYAYWTEIPRIQYFVNHVVGNWRDYPLPQMRPWKVEFTKREIMDEMKTMMNHAENEDLFAKAEAGLLSNAKALPTSSIRTRKR